MLGIGLKKKDAQDRAVLEARPQKLTHHRSPVKQTRFQENEAYYQHSLNKLVMMN